MRRIAFFIDGFNFYYSLKEDPRYHKYKWLNFAKLADFYKSRGEEISAIFYFTAYYHRLPRRWTVIRNWLRPSNLWE